MSIVADFFAGSGTTGRVAKRLGRNYILCDMNPDLARFMEQEPCTDFDNPVDKVYIMDNLILMNELYSRHGSFIDLIYIDPPFGRNNVDKQFGIDWSKFEDGTEFCSRMFGLVSKSLNQQHKNYLLFLYERLELMYKLLKPTGSIYVHCDSGF